jgi:hypothetical protein
MAAAPCLAKNTSCNVTDTILLFFIQFMAPTGNYILLSHTHWFQSSSNETSSSIANRSDYSSNTNAKTKKTKNGSNNSTHIIMVQVFFSLIFSMPVFAFRMYTTLSSPMPKSNVRLSVENFIFNVTLMTFYFEKVCSFYI